MIKFSVNDYDSPQVVQKLYERFNKLKYRCPVCVAPFYPKRLFYDKPCRCNACGKKITWRTGTIFADSKLKPKEIYAILLLTGLGKTDKEIAEFTDVALQTVRVIILKTGLRRVL